MLITGYHGTTETYALKILADESFYISCSNKEWLGNGIYFYEKFSDAYAWRPASGEKKVVLHSVVSIDDNGYIDIDSPTGEKVWMEILDYICKVAHIKLTGTAQENQCAICRMIWDSDDNIMVLAASFATTRTRVQSLIDKRTRRREFCVRNNEPIKCTQIINYEG